VKTRRWGIPLVALALFLCGTALAVARAGTKSEDAADPQCAVREVPLDAGYGVTRVELRRVCR
jgi:hypothetical protein